MAISKKWSFSSRVLEKALSKYLKEKIRITGSGRTDSGVHASEQSAHFKTKNKINNKNIFINSVNFFLKKYPVSILNIQKDLTIFMQDIVQKREPINILLLIDVLLLL